MRLNGKTVNLTQLKVELAAAGVTVPALGTMGDDLHTYNAQGERVDLPAAATAVVAAHTPPVPRDYGTDTETVVTQVDPLVTQLKAFIAAPAPTAAEQTAIVKLLCRIALLSLRRLVG